MQQYRHTQAGTLIVATVGGAAALTGVIAVLAPVGPGTAIAAAVAVILVACLVIFGSLTVEVAEGRVAVWFGPGVARRVIRLDEIRDARAVRNPWYYGWGIRLTPRGWLYNVSGFDAVELELHDGRRFGIGTDEPERLLAAVRPWGSGRST